MKKFLAMILAIAMTVSVAACGKDTKEDPSGATPLDILTKVWNAYEKDEKFNAAGGDPTNSVMDQPGKFDVADIENLDVQLGFPQASVALIEDAASLVHMIGNIFTAGAYYVTDPSEIELLTSDMQDNILSRQWLDAIPDKLLIVSVGENIVISVFGQEELVDTFQKKLVSIYDEVEVYADEKIK